MMPQLRLYSGDEPEPQSPHQLATRELLRPPAHSPGPRDLPPFTRAWFEEIELKRYLRHGAWLPRLLEFTRHGGESLVMRGPGLGSDALQYLRHGTAVTICIGPADKAEMLRQNFAYHGREARLVHVGDGEPLPFPRATFDLAYFNALFSTPADPVAAAAEFFRILKPGGKLFALFPARHDVDGWQRWLMPARCLYRDLEPRPTTGPRRTVGELRNAFQAFHDMRTFRRHLRKSELPHLWRWLPTDVLERVMGRITVVRAFKPLTAAVAGVAAAA